MFHFFVNYVTHIVGQSLALIFINQSTLMT